MGRKEGARGMTNKREYSYCKSELKWRWKLNLLNELGLSRVNANSWRYAEEVFRRRTGE
jgi:hypothetical protein